MNIKQETGTILIIDDNPSNLNLFTDTLEHQGYDVLVALSGESGIERASYAKPDLILLDVMLPGISGFDVCRQLKASPETSNIPVIFMTALNEIENKVEGFQVGAVDYVNKPVQQDELLQRVRIHLRLHRLTNQLEQVVAEQTQALRDSNQKLLQEITERKQAQTDLQSERNLLRTLINTIPDLVYVKDRESRFVVVNQAVASLMGQKSPEDVVGKRDIDFLAQSDSQHFYQEEQEIVKTGKPLLNHEEYFYSESAQRFSHILTTKVPLKTPDGQIIGLVGIGKDISDYHAAQERIKYDAMLLANTSDAIISTNHEHYILSWNRAATQLYGWTADEAIGQYAPDLFRTNYLGLTRDKLLEHLATHGEYRGEFIHKHKNGADIPVFSNITVLKNERDETTGYVTIIHDITLQKRHEAQNLALARMQERSEVLNNLLGAISHDLKTPLTIIETNLHLMEHATTPERRAEKSAAIRRQTQRLQKLIEDLLTMSRLDHLPSLTYSKVKIDQLLNDIVLSLDPSFRQKDQEVQLTCESLVTIQANETELYRAFTNLIDNAINYSYEGGMIEIKTWIEDNQVVTAIRDQGIGISNEDLPHIFERYYRADKARNIYTGGSGLGLAIVKRIIEIHQGSIKVESQINEGTTFYVYLPVKRN